MNKGLKMIEAAVQAERRRCADIVQLAREGEIDADLRSIISRIRSGTVAVPDDIETP